MSKRSESFDKRFDELSRVYSDPVEILFKIASGVISMGPDFINEEGEPVYMPVPLSDRRAAASDLCSYRYSKRKAIEIADTDGNEGFSFVMIAPGQKPAKPLPGPDKVATTPLEPQRATVSGKALPIDYIPAAAEFA